MCSCVVCIDARKCQNKRCKQLLLPSYSYSKVEIRSTKLLLRLPPRDPDILPQFSIPRHADHPTDKGMDTVEMDHVVVLPACAVDSPCQDNGGIDTLLFWRIGKAPRDGSASRGLGYRVDVD